MSSTVTSKHRWQYADLPGGEYPRPAQRCARCGMVRRRNSAGGFYTPWWYYESDRQYHKDGADDEPPCTPERPATPTEGP